MINNSNRLIGWEAHGFRTMEELDVKTIIEEAKSRWLRPNEIYAILCNFKYFIVNVKPVNLPTSGTFVLFDRKTLRNFRKDGHNWKKKKGSNTVKEAHEHLKVGDEERIHVYYAHGEENPTFARRCYWLLDKARENIVLVHYRETQEFSPVSALNSNSSSPVSGPPASWTLSNESDYVPTPTYDTADKAQGSGNEELYASKPGCSMILESHKTRLYEINTLEWEELLAPDDPNKFSALNIGKRSCLLRQNQFGTNRDTSYDNSLSADNLQKGNPLGNCSGSIPQANSNSFTFPVNDIFQKREPLTITDMQKMNSQSLIAGNGDLQTQDSFDMWMNCFMDDSPVSLDESVMQSPNSISRDLSTSPATNLQSPNPERIFVITDISPARAFSTEETKILITGFFGKGHSHLEKSVMYCVFQDVHVRLEMVQSGVFRCFVPPHYPGVVDLYVSIDRHTPISQILTFEYRAPLMNNSRSSLEDNPNWEEFRLQMRLVRLLFSNSERPSAMPSNLPVNTISEAKNFASRSSHIAACWGHLDQSIQNNKVSFEQANRQLFELSLMNRLREWLVDKILDGCKMSDRDDLGQGVIHLCAILDYRWAVYPYAWSGLSLDYRDKFGWTALHWAAYYGREKMVATLLSAGAKPFLVTDPTSENLGGCTAADLASKNGHEGLAAYLAEKALLNHFNDMSIAGNVSGSLQNSTSHSVGVMNIAEDELCLKESLTAYRTAAEAAARIRSAFRLQSFKLRTKEVQRSNPEDEAHSIVAAMRIQHAFREYGTRKQMAAAARIQHCFRTWKTRKEFLKLRRHTVKIQALFRAFQVRKQYKKVTWSVGVLEKAILRWRMKRKGFRGLKNFSGESVKDQDQDQGTIAEEAFFRDSRKQVEERIERSVIRVQAMFRSKIAQQEYRRMKLAVDQAKLEYEGLVSPDIDMK